MQLIDLAAEVSVCGKRHHSGLFLLATFCIKFQTEYFWVTPSDGQMKLHEPLVVFF